MKSGLDERRRYDAAAVTRLKDRVVEAAKAVSDEGRVSHSGSSPVCRACALDEALAALREEGEE